MKKKKYNNESNKFADWTTKKLKQEAIDFDYMINQIECYGLRDMSNLLGILKELKNRKVKIGSRLYFN